MKKNYIYHENRHRLPHPNQTTEMKKNYIYHENEPFWSVKTVIQAMMLGIILGFGIGLVIGIVL